MSIGKLLNCLAWGVVLWIPMASASAQSLLADGFETPFNFPKTDVEAARFLNQSTFGATPSSISSVRQGSLESWIRSQTLLAPTLSRPFLEQLTPSLNQAGQSLSQTHRIQRWFDTAVTAPDQLRQRIAWALGQLIVVSDQDANLNGEPVMMAEWNDLLVRHALGNYRDLLGDVVRSPMMGRYLTHLRNRKFELTPRCYDQRPPLDDNTNLDNDQFDGMGNRIPVLDASDFHSCTGTSATNDGSQNPVIAAYRLPTGGLIAPDENFAREVMQLFSIGLIERNADFSPFPDASNPTPTYDQNTITTLSRVLTGLSYACSGNRSVAGQNITRTCSCSGTDCSYVTGNFSSTPPSLSLNGQSGLVHPDRYAPMICYPRYHDVGRDRTGFQLPGSEADDPVGASIVLTAGQTIPGGTPARDKQLELGGVPMLTIAEVGTGLGVSTAPNCDTVGVSSPPEQKNTCLTYCDDSLDAAIDLLFLEPNTASMVARHLIQRLVSSNPSPAYIQRVSETFADNGRGVRGDLAAVVSAVLLDSEARLPPDDLPIDAGKPREPLLRLVHVWRSFGAQSGDSDPSGYRRWARFSCPTSGSWPQCAYEQRPLGAPSVFNFYQPDYRAPGEVSDLELDSPELQILNESSAVLGANDLYGHICAGRGNSNNCHAPLTSPPPADRAYFANAVIDQLPGGNCGTSCSGSQDASLIEAINLRLLAGTMSGALGAPESPSDTLLNTGMKGTLLRLLQQGITGSLGEADPQQARRREILYLLHLVAISPEYNTQR